MPTLAAWIMLTSLPPSPWKRHNFFENPTSHCPRVFVPTYGTRRFLRVFLEQVDNLSLLRWRAAATDYARTLAREVYKFCLVMTETDLRECENKEKIISILISTSKEEPVITRAESLFRRKSFNWRWASRLSETFFGDVRERKTFVIRFWKPLEIDRCPESWTPI